MEVFRLHRENLARIYGPFEENKSFERIIRAEYDKWLHTDVKIKAELDRMLKKSAPTPLPAHRNGCMWRPMCASSYSRTWGWLPAGVQEKCEQ